MAAVLRALEGDISTIKLRVEKATRERLTINPINHDHPLHHSLKAQEVKDW
jgi:hypothetical protein